MDDGTTSAVAVSVPVGTIVVPVATEGAGGADADGVGACVSTDVAPPVAGPVYPDNVV